MPRGRRRCTKGHDRQGGSSSRRTRSVYNRSPRDLAGQADQGSNRQDETYIDLSPFLRGQIDGDEGSKPCLHIRNEEDEPVETAVARVRRGRGWGPVRLARQRNAILIVAAVRMGSPTEYVVL
jgi:hypothetical protein